ncbi:cytochrome c biogenesis protein ResB [Actinomyces wuliandei]|uniref:cytochrome c biogenesis protein ResB n=1 Tax=Actinomyces wuliandei TaxID=2057743 RepID=UPI000FD7FD18|nr:cytochrome c biogenesis protein ResB [Actinomyces wuliandei]
MSTTSNDPTSSPHGTGSATGASGPGSTGGSDPVDGLDDQAALSLGPILRQAYSFFYKKTVGLALILLTGTLSLLGVIIPQMPAGSRVSEEATAQWLESVRPTFGGWTDVLRALGFFTMFSSVPFLVVMGLLALSITACTMHRLPVLWRAARHPRTRVTARFFDRARLRARFTAPVSAEQAFEVICSDARRHHLRVVVDERGPGYNAYMDRSRWAPFGTVLAHLAFLVIMAGFVISSVTGFRDEQFALTVGYPREVGHGTSLVAEARGFQDTYYDDGSPQDYVADLVVSKDGQEVAAQEVRVNHPLTYDGVMFHQSYFGVSAVMEVTDESGTQVFHGGVALDRTTSDETLVFGSTPLPDGTTAYVIGSASGQTGTGIEPGQMRVEVYQGEDNTPVDEAVLDTGVPTQVGGHTFTFEREQQFTGMIVRRDPGAGVVWVGFALLAVGTCATMFFPHRRLWVRVTDTGGSRKEALVQMASPDRRDSSFTRLFTDMTLRVSRTMTRHTGPSHTEIKRN